MVQVWKRWVPAAVGVVVVAGAAIALPLSANATATLAAKTPQEVLTLALNSSVTAFSGTVEQTSDLGLPSLPTGTANGSGTGSGAGAGTGTGSSDDAATSAASSAIELLTGTHTARVYVDGPTNLRLQVLDQLAERDVIRQGSTVWLYDSSEQTAVKSTLPDKAQNQAPDALPTSPEETATPQQLAQKFLDAVDPTTDVSVGGEVTVAGRSAYDLVLTPQSGDTLVGAVSIAVDSETGLPLRVEVTAKGAADPAFSTGFTALDLSTPSSDLFAFTPPAGTDVTEKAVPAKPDASAEQGTKPDAVTGQKPVVTGTGWSSIVELPAGADASALTSSPLLAQLTTAVGDGHLLSTTLVNVFITNDGRVFAGSVPAEALEAAAAQ